MADEEAGIFKHCSYQALRQNVSVQKTILTIFFFALSFSCFIKRASQNFFLNYLISLGIWVSCVAWETTLGKPKKTTFSLVYKCWLGELYFYKFRVLSMLIPIMLVQLIRFLQRWESLYYEASWWGLCQKSMK